MLEPPVAQRKERIPPVLHLLLSAGESLVQVSSSTSSSPLHLLFSSSYSRLFALISLLFTSFSPSKCLFLFTTSSSSSSSLFKVGKRSLALPPLSLSLFQCAFCLPARSQSGRRDGLWFPPLLCWELSITEDPQRRSHNSDSASLWLNMTRYFYPKPSPSPSP